MDMYENTPFPPAENPALNRDVYVDIAGRLLTSPLATIEDVDYAHEQDAELSQPHTFKLGLSQESIGAGLVQLGLQEVPVRGYVEYVEPFTMDKGETLEPACVFLSIWTLPFGQSEDDAPILLNRTITIEASGEGHIEEQYSNGETRAIGDYDGTYEKGLEITARNRRQLRNEDMLFLLEVVENELSGNSPTTPTIQMY